MVYIHHFGASVVGVLGYHFEVVTNICILRGTA